MKEALRPPSGSPIIGGQWGLLGSLYSFLRRQALISLRHTFFLDISSASCYTARNIKHFVL